MRRQLTILLCLFAGQASADGLDLPADSVSAGAVLYGEHCADCHGENAAGAAGPEIQGMILGDVLTAVKGVEAMPEVELEDGDAEAIAHYLMSLAPDQARRRLRLP